MGPNSKKNVTKLKKKSDQTPKKIVIKQNKKHHKNCEKLPWELVGCQGVEVIKKKLWQNLKTQIVREKKPKNLNCDKTQKL